MVMHKLALWDCLDVSINRCVVNIDVWALLDLQGSLFSHVVSCCDFPFQNIFKKKF